MRRSVGTRKHQPDARVLFDHGLARLVRSSARFAHHFTRPSGRYSCSRGARSRRGIQRMTAALDVDDGRAEEPPEVADAAQLESMEVVVLPMRIRRSRSLCDGSGEDGDSVLGIVADDGGISRARSAPTLGNSGSELRPEECAAILGCSIMPSHGWDRGNTG